MKRRPANLIVAGESVKLSYNGTDMLNGFRLKDSVSRE
jgi:hypothetical protein